MITFIEGLKIGKTNSKQQLRQFTSKELWFVASAFATTTLAWNLNYLRHSSVKYFIQKMASKNVNAVCQQSLAVMTTKWIWCCLIKIGIQRFFKDNRWIGATRNPKIKIFQLVPQILSSFIDFLNVFLNKYAACVK